MVSPLEFPENKPLPIHPYLLGVLLGDGCMASKDSVTLTTPDQWIADEINQHIEDTLQINRVKSITRCPTWQFARKTKSTPRNPLVVDLEDLGLMGSKSIHKFIPNVYLYGSAKSRTDLLAGLLDTDGYANQHTCEYGTSSPQLAKDVVHLIQSLGGTATVNEYTSASGNQAYRLYICPPAGVNWFRLPRKAEQFVPRTKYSARRVIDSVVYVGDMESACIQIDSSDHLYITDDFIVTHNTYGALLLARGLAGETGKIAVIDTERGSASLYSDLVDFDVAELAPPYSPARYRELIMAAAKEYDVLVIDSLSHAWTGEGGVLDMHDKATMGSKGGNSYTAWRDVTPQHNALVDAILACPCHVITTMRSKTAYELQENDRGKKTPIKIGLAPVQRDGMEYEFTLVLDVSVSGHVANSSKDRTRLWDGRNDRITIAHGEELRRWLESGSQFDLADIQARLNGLQAGHEISEYWRNLGVHKAHPQYTAVLALFSAAKARIQQAEELAAVRAAEALAADHAAHAAHVAGYQTTENDADNFMADYAAETEQESA